MLASVLVLVNVKVLPGVVLPLIEKPATGAIGIISDKVALPRAVAL
ncbi:Uncharacterised protein [uncultured archaeon]|nr:Uncharacterised protein [uncultured archaeon]